VRGAEVSKELARKSNIQNATLLDIGCGIGGPCRMLATEFNCKATGIDLSEEFIRTAIGLSELLGLEESTTFIQGDATLLLFTDDSFEVVWTQHVQMNIHSKAQFYSEITRVLEKDGTFIYYDIFKKDSKPVTYPMPWANNSDISFLQPPSLMSSLLKQYGLSEVHAKDETHNGIVFFESMLKKISENGPQTLGLNVLMGTSTKEKISNLLNGLKDGKLLLQSGIYKKRD